jgi:CPA1 family monovalent cation:H+ antiporter
MSELEFVVLVLAAIGPLLALAKLTGVPPLFLLAGAGLGSAFLPGLPPVRVDPQFLLSLFLPPLLYAGTVQASGRWCMDTPDVQENQALKPIGRF